MTEPAEATKAEQPRKAELLLVAATRLFTQRGIAAVSVKDIAKEAGATIPTLYRAWEGGKPELVVVTLGQWSEDHLAKLQAALQAGGDGPQRLDRLFAFLASWSRRRGFRGSYIMNAAAELTTLAAMDPKAEAAAREVIKEHQQAEHRLLLKFAQSIDAADPDGLADQLQLIWYGAIDRARLSSAKRRKEVVETARAIAHAMLDQAAPTPVQQ